jgi:hypothetical protein
MSSRSPTCATERIVSGNTKANQLSSLLPWAWKASQVQAAVNI